TSWASLGGAAASAFRSRALRCDGEGCRRRSKHGGVAAPRRYRHRDGALRDRTRSVADGALGGWRDARRRRASSLPCLTRVPTALVTGATGLVGSHIVEQLRGAGWNVRALLRQPSAVRQVSGWDAVAWLRGQDVEPVSGDILDLPSFVEAARGCDTLFHTAAAVPPWPSRIHPYDAYRVPNVDGARNAIAAAARSSARLLQLSSVAVYGPQARYTSSKATGVDETMPLDPLPERAYYARSKRESEELVISAHVEGRIWA